MFSQGNTGSVFGNKQANTNTQPSVFGSNTQQAASGQLFGGLISKNPTTSATSTAGIFGGQSLGTGAGFLSNTNQQNINAQTQPPTQNSNLAPNGNQGLFNANNPSNPPALFTKQNSFAPGGGISTAPTTTAPIFGGVNNNTTASNPLTLNNQNPTTQTNTNTTNTLNFGIGGQNAVPNTNTVNTSTLGVGNQASGTLFGSKPGQQKLSQPGNLSTTPTNNINTSSTSTIFPQTNQTNTQQNNKPVDSTKGSLNLNFSNQTTQPNQQKTGLSFGSLTPQTKQSTSNPTFTINQQPKVKTGMEETKLGNPNQPTQSQSQNQTQPQSQPQNQHEKLYFQFEKSNKTAGEYVDQWRKLLIQSYKQLSLQCQLNKSYYNQRKQNYAIIRNFKQLEPVVLQNKKTHDQMLDRIEKKQNQILQTLLEMKQRLGNDTNQRMYRQNQIATQIQNYRAVRKEVNAQDQKFAGEQEQDPSNQQLRNIFLNLDSVQNQIRRLNHVVDHYFGKITF